MRRRALQSAAVALAFGFTTAPALAEQVVVRTGEHGTFTRLVLGFEAPPQVALEPLSGGLRVTARRDDVEYDLSRAWRRISRSRVVDLVPGPDGALDIRLGCDCAAHAFDYPPSLIVIDVADDRDRLPNHPTAVLGTPGPAGTPAPILRPAPKPASEPGPAPAPRPEPEPEPVPAVTLPVLPDVLTSGLPLIVQAEEWTGPVPAEPEPEPEPEAPGIDLSAFGADLAAMVSRGVDRGLLDPVHGAPEGPRPVGPQLRIGTAADGDRVSPARPGVDGLAPGYCPSGRVSDMLPGATPPADDLVAAIQEARAELYGEFDQLNPVAADALIGAHLTAGLGAEARTVVDLAAMAGAMEATDRDALRAVAALVDAPVPAAAVEGWAGCDGAAALWAVLALEGRPLPQALDRGAVVGAVSMMPPTLRLHLAPRLAGAFLDDGDGATARLVRNAATRAGATPDRAMRLVDLRLEIDRNGGDSGTMARLARLASDADEVAVQAMLILLRTGGDAVSEASLTDAAILLAERRGLPEGEALRGALAGAYQAAGQWDEAFAVVRDAPASHGATADLWEALARGLVLEAGDAVFLRLAFAEGPVLAAAPIPQEVMAAIAVRREALGFGAPPAPAMPDAPPVAEPVPPSGALEAVAEVADIPAPGSPSRPPGPISESMERLEQSRQRRADLAAFLAEIDAGDAADDPALP